MPASVDIKASGFIACGVGDLGIHEGIAIECCQDGADMREKLKGANPKTVAIIGQCVSDVSALNLAAAIHKDNPLIQIILLCNDKTGSLQSNAKAAGVTAIMSETEFASLLNGAHGKDARRDKPLVVSVMSGRGGVGKSAISIALSLASLAAGVRVALIDCDVQFSDLEFLCASDSKFSKAPVSLTGFAPGFDAKAHGNGSVLLACPQLRSEYSDSANDMLRAVLEQLEGAADVVFVNTGSYWFDLHAQIADLSDLCLMIMDQRASSIQGCKRAKDLCKRMGFASSKFAFVLNRCSAKGRFNSYNCAMSLGVGEAMSIDDGGDDVLEAMSLGTPSSLLDSGNPMIESSKKVAANILGRFGLINESAAPVQVGPVKPPHAKKGIRRWKRHVSVG